MVKVKDQYELRELKVDVWSVQSSKLGSIPTAGCISVNACAVHPFDHFLYCFCQRMNGESWIVRFDRGGLMQVFQSSESSNAAAFDEQGMFYYLGKSAMFSIKSLGLENPVETRLYSFAIKKAAYDITIGKIDLNGDGKMKYYVLGLTSELDLMIFSTSKECLLTCMIKVRIVDIISDAEPPDKDAK